jgi:3-oxoacyl-[acyl-carrier protein] reductase
LRSTLSKNAEQQGKSAEEVAANRVAGIPARRFGNADEFGAACAFLCSTHAGYITGQNLLIDGGLFNGAF